MLCEFYSNLKKTLIAYEPSKKTDFKEAVIKVNLFRFFI